MEDDGFVYLRAAVCVSAFGLCYRLMGVEVHVTFRPND